MLLRQDKNSNISLYTTLKMRLLGVILELILAFHVTAQRNHGDYSSSVQEKLLYHRAAAENSKRHHSIDPISSFLSALLCPLTASTDCQAPYTDTATDQPTVEPTVQPTVKSTVRPTVKSTVKPTVKSTVQPTVQPTDQPIDQPIDQPTDQWSSLAGPFF